MSVYTAPGGTLRQTAPAHLLDMPCTLPSEEYLNIPYNETFAENRYYGQMLVDYAELPANFETYDTEDQRRIEQRMATIKAAVAAGETLSETPMPLEKD